MVNSGEIATIPDRMTVSNKMLIANARLSPVEIQANTGIPALEAAEKITELLGNRNWLSAFQKEQLLIMDMEDVIADAKQRLANVGDEFYADIAAVVIRAMTGIGTRLDAQRKLVQFNIDEISRAQASVFGQAFDIALWHVVDKLMIENPQIDKSEVRQLVREGMKLAAAKLNEHTSDE